MATITVYGVKKGQQWLAKVGANPSRSYRITFRPWDDERACLTSIRAQAEQWAAELGGAVKALTYAA